MPEVTSVVVFSGLSGLIVVPARLNSKSPARAVAPPTRAMATNTAPRTTSVSSSEGPERDGIHSNAPISNATTGGGIFSSSAPIGLCREACSVQQQHGKAARSQRTQNTRHVDVPAACACYAAPRSSSSAALPTGEHSYNAAPTSSKHHSTINALFSSDAVKAAMNQSVWCSEDARAQRADNSGAARPVGHSAAAPSSWNLDFEVRAGAAHPLAATTALATRWIRGQLVVVSTTTSLPPLTANVVSLARQPTDAKRLTSAGG